MSDIGRIIRREERIGKPEDAPLAEPAPQPEPAVPDRESVPA
jgi:hypothetical protein